MDGPAAQLLPEAEESAAGGLGQGAAGSSAAARAPLRAALLGSTAAVLAVLLGSAVCQHPASLGTLRGAGPGLSSWAGAMVELVGLGAGRAGPSASLGPPVGTAVGHGVPAPAPSYTSAGGTGATARPGVDAVPARRLVSQGPCTVCRLGPEDHSLDGMGTARIVTLSLEPCRQRCLKDGSCTGIEFRRSESRCELWTRPILLTPHNPFRFVPDDFECFKKAAVQCPQLPAVKHSSLTAAAVLEHPTSVKVKCDAGYSTDGSSLPASKAFEVQCSADGTLQATPHCAGTTLSCLPIKCGAAPLIPSADTSPPKARVFVFGEEADYACPDGHTLDGTAAGRKTINLRCDADGKFPTPAACKPVSCGPVPGVKNAAADAKEVTFPGAVVYTCEKGYTAVGSASTFQRRCLASGQYSALPAGILIAGGQAVCAKSCSLSVAHSSLSGVVELKYSATVSVKCDPGFSTDASGTPASASFEVQCGADGALRGSPPAAGGAGTVPSCVAIKCGAAPLVPSATSPLATRVFVFGEDAAFACLEGHTVDGTAAGSKAFNLRCGADGKFPAASACRPVSCGPVPGATHAAASVKEAAFPGTVVYTCDQGYSAGAGGASRFQRQCLASGQYSALPDGVKLVSGKASCVKDCSLAIAHSSASPAVALQYPSVLKVKCDVGYSTDGSGAAAAASFDVQCSADGTLSRSPAGSAGALPSCLPITCGAAPKVAAASTFPAASRVFASGEEAAYSCPVCHSLDGTATGSRTASLRCRTDGTFPAPPACKRLQAYSIQGRVADATNPKLGLAGTAVEVRSATSAVLGHTLTDKDGSFRLECVPAGTVTLIANVSAYIENTKVLDLHEDIVTSDSPIIVLSPKMPVGDWRVVLTWNERPFDIDSHVYFGQGRSCHTWYKHRDSKCGGIDGNLDVDNTRSFGPETITLKNVAAACLSQPAAACDVVYKVYIFSEGDDVFPATPATVKLYSGAQQVATFRATENVGFSKGKWWSVFRLDVARNKVLPCDATSCNTSLDADV